MSSSAPAASRARAADAKKREKHAAEPVKLTHRQVLTILSGLMLGMFLAALDQNIVSVAIVKIANDLHGYEQQAWATTAYLITATITTPLYGKLSDIYGRKPFYLTAITLFVIGSVACTFVNSMYQLAAFRAFQGLGAGGLMSLALTIVGDIVPPRERVRYQGYFMITFGSSTVLGPVLGGFFSDVETLGGIDGWRWVFLINVPIGIIALFVVAKVLNVPHQPKESRVDWFGAIALAVSVVPLLLVAEQGRSWGWGSTQAVVCYAIAAFGLVLFLFVEYVMKDEALIPLRLFNNPTFAVAIAASTIVGIAMFGGIIMVPQYLQVVRGFTPTEAGLLMLPLVAGIMIGSQISGRVTAKTGRYKILPVIGTLLLSAGAALFGQIHYDTPLWQPLVFAVIIGLGLGGCMQTLVIAAQNAGPRSDMGVSTATATFFRQIGGTLGVAVFLTIMFNLLPGKISDAFGGRLPVQFQGQMSQLESNTSVIATLPDQVRIPILTGFTNAMHGVFFTAAVVALVATVVLLFLKEIPLKGGPGPAPAKDNSPVVEPKPAMDSTKVEEALPEKEPALVGASTGGKHALRTENGHGEYRLDPSRAPALAAATALSDGDTAELPRLHSGNGSGQQAISGYVRRQDGTGVASAALTLIDQVGHQVSRATAGSDGRYRIEAPGTGNYVLIVSAAGYQPQAANVMLHGEGTELDLTLVGSGGLTGVIRVAGSGTPVAKATVTLTDTRGEVTAAAMTDRDGSYSFSGVGAGTYTIAASAPNMRPVAQTLIVPDNRLLSHDIELVPAITLSGTARTGDGRVVPDARITVLDAGGQVAAVTHTDENGEYLVSDLPEGEYTVVASGYPPATSKVALTGGEVSHDVRLGYDQVFDGLAEHK